MMKNPFLKRIMNAETEDVVHSSAYAKAQNERGIGAASAEGFAQRMRIDKNREFVRRYGESQVVNEARKSAAKPIADSKMRGTIGATGATGVQGGTTGAARTLGVTGATGATGAGKQPPMRRNPGIPR